MDEITNGQATETQTTDTVAEENTQANQEQQSNEQEQVDTNVENSNEDVQGEDTQQNTVDVKQEPTTEELKNRLKEYEVREEEDKLLRQRLGLQDVDSQTFNYMNVEQQIINEGKQQYLKLCTEYGIDANPDRIDQSIEELKKTDPAKGYEFIYKFEALGQEVSNRRRYVQQEVNNYEVSKFNNDYNQLLNASPALQHIVASYIQNYSDRGNMYNQLEGVMNIILPAYQEAFEAGKAYSLQDKARKDTTQVSGGIATSPTTTTYSGDGTFTRDQIKKMSSEEFAKNEVAIRQAMLEGKII